MCDTFPFSKGQRGVWCPDEPQPYFSQHLPHYTFAKTNHPFIVIVAKFILTDHLQNMKKILFLILTIASFYNAAQAQLLEGKTNFTHADTLRGTLTPLRTCYDINYYHLDVKFDIEKNSSAVVTCSDLRRRRISKNCNSTCFQTLKSKR